MAAHTPSPLRFWRIEGFNCWSAVAGWPEKTGNSSLAQSCRCRLIIGTWLSGHEPKQKHHHGCGKNANPRWFCLGDSPWCPGGLIWHCNSGEGQFPWCGHAAAHGAYGACFSSGRGLRDLRPEAGTYQKKCPPHPRCHFFGLQSPWGEADPTPCRWDHPDRPTNGPSTSIWGRGRWRPTHLPAVKQTEV